MSTPGGSLKNKATTLNAGLLDCPGLVQKVTEVENGGVFSLSISMLYSA